MDKILGKIPIKPTPLWIIATLVLIPEITLVYIIMNTTGAVQGWLTAFFMLFNISIVAGFFAILWQKPYVLYGPSEYGGEADVTTYTSAMMGMLPETTPKLQNAVRSSEVPRLEFHRALDPQDDFPFGGILLTDKAEGGEDPPSLYLAIYFRTRRYTVRGTVETGKWLYVEANMRPALNLRIQVKVQNNSGREVMKFLREDGDGWGWKLFGNVPVAAERLYRAEDRLDVHASDQLLLWREKGERRLMMSTFTATNAGMSIHARLSNEATLALVNYLAGTSLTSGTEFAPSAE
jgi:hypothetical protein